MSYLAKARTHLVLDQPFIATLLLKTPIIEDASVETAETDGTSVWVNPEFLKTLSLQETIFLCAHETLHGAFLHCLSRGNRDPQLWNEATDYVINGILTEERIGQMPKGGLYNPDLVKRGNGTADGVYAILSKEKQSKPKGPGKGKGQGPGKPLDKLRDGNGKPIDKIIDIKEAEGAARACGKLSKGLERLVKELTRTKTDWKSVLRRFVSERARTELSYARPNRRYLMEDFVLPSLRSEQLGRIAIAIDCSGSINQRTLSAFESEIRMIIEDVRPSSIELIYFDADVTHVETLGPDDTLKLKPHGGGGTAFSPIFEHIAKGEVPACCVVLTDLCCSGFGPMPDYPVLWASTDPREAPFGEIMHIELTDKEGS